MSTTSAPATGRRERKKQQTRDALESAALRLFLQRGFDETTVEDITEVADVAKRTFFRYFESKEEVVFADQAQKMAFLREQLDARPPSEGVLGAIRSALHELAALHQVDRERNLVRARIALHAPSVRSRGAQARQEWEDVIASWITARLGAEPDDLRPALIAGATIAGLGAALGRWVAGGGLEDPAHLVDEALDLLESGFGL